MTRKQSPTAKLTLSTQDRDFFASLGQAIFMNTFGEEREALLGRVSPGHAGEALHLDPKFYAFVAEVNRRIDRLDHRGRTTIQQFADRDGEVMQPVFLYQVYHRYVAELDAVIQKQLGMKDAATPVSFAEALIADLGQRGFTEEQSLHYLAMFYQLRRAFFFILDALVGDSPSMQQLRRALWNSVFTHLVAAAMLAVLAVPCA